MIAFDRQGNDLMYEQEVMCPRFSKCARLSELTLLLLTVRSRNTGCPKWRL